MPGAPSHKARDTALEKEQKASQHSERKAEREGEREREREGGRESERGRGSEGEKANERREPPRAECRMDVCAGMRREEGGWVHGDRRARKSYLRTHR